MEEFGQIHTYIGSGCSKLLLDASRRRRIINELLIDPNKDVTTIEVDLKLSTLKPIHGKVMCQIFDFFKTNEGQVIVKNGFEAAGITEAVENARNGVFTDLNPYK